MKTKQFIGLPWAQLPKESASPFPWQGSAPSPQCSVAAGRGQTALPGNWEGRRQRETSVSYVQVFVLQC